MSETCDICQTQEDCLAGKCPCDLFDGFIANVPREVANKLLAEYNTYKAAILAIETILREK